MYESCNRRIIFSKNVTIEIHLLIVQRRYATYSPTQTLKWNESLYCSTLYFIIWSFCWLIWDYVCTLIKKFCLIFIPRYVRYCTGEWYTLIPTRRRKRNVGHCQHRWTDKQNCKILLQETSLHETMLSISVNW